MNDKIIQSAWGIVYFFDGNEPKYLLIKRYAMSNKMERVAPKGKIQGNEKIENTVLREVSEEAGIPINQMILKQKIWITQLRNTENIKWHMNKDVTYFLVEYQGAPEDVQIDQVEWYIWVYKRANIQEVLWLIYYKNIREIFRQAHLYIIEKWKKKEIMKDFMSKLDD